MTIGKRHENLVLCLCVAVLAVVGAVMVYSASFVTAQASDRCGHDAAYFLKRQILFLVVGASIAVWLARRDYDFFRRSLPWLLCASFFMLLLVYVPGMRKTVKGASRWISLYFFSFQPSELAKFVVLGYAAWGIDRMGENPKGGIRPFLPMLGVLALFAGVILAEPDFGMSFVIVVSFLALLFLAGFPWRWLAGMAAAGAAAVVALVAAKPYRMARIQAFLDPFSQAQAAGYQVIQSLIAFSNGGLIGTGIGAGKQKLFYLPEIHTDYIFSVIGEELGFVGVVAVGACFVTMTAIGFRIGRRARDLFGKYLAMGISTVIGLQALANMMVGLKMLPPKGMVLPFMSYGGSSLVIHLAAIGVLVNISMKGADAIVAPADHSRWRNRRACLSGHCAR